MTTTHASIATQRDKTVVLAHGGGGVLTDQFVASAILPRLGNDILGELLDSSFLDLPAGRLAMTIDGYVVQPLQFPGGNIGRLAISGTVNDLAVTGAVPRGIALSLILEEGLDRAILDTVLDSMQAAAAEAAVKVITGDTKVVGRGQCDGMYVVTAGVGTVPNGRRVHPSRVEPGDAILVSGTVGDHGLAVMLAREMPHVKSVLTSDVAPLNTLIAAALDASADNIVFMRDPTRGGLAGVLADLATRTGFRVQVEEERIPVKPETLHAAEMLGIDVLDVANEGKVVIVVRPAAADAVLTALRSHSRGQDAAIIGTITSQRDAICELLTPIGGSRVLQKPYGEQLPRIC